MTWHMVEYQCWGRSVQFPSHVGRHSSRSISCARVVQQLWQNTVAALPPDQGVEAEVSIAYKFFAELCHTGAVSPKQLEPLIRPGAVHQPPRAMTHAALMHYYAIILRVNRDLGLVQESPHKPDVPQFEVASGGDRLLGFDYLYEVLVKAYQHSVAVAAADQLVKVYVQPYSEYGRCHASWKTCAATRCSALLAMATLLPGIACSLVTASLNPVSSSSSLTSDTHCLVSIIYHLVACSFVGDVVGQLTRYALLICGRDDSAPDAAEWATLAEQGTAIADSKLVQVLTRPVPGCHFAIALCCTKCIASCLPCYEVHPPQHHT